jgi:hypothetical protein
MRYYYGVVVFNPLHHSPPFKEDQMKQSFIFYKSFYEAIKELPDENKLEILGVILGFSFEENYEKNLQELSPISRSIFALIRPQLEANHKKYENGCKGKEYGKLGGRPRKEKNPKETPKKPQANPKLTPNDNENDNDNDIKKTKTKKLFEEFWELYDYKKSKPKALKAYESALKKTDHANIIEGVRKYKEARGVDCSYWKHPTTWLNQGCWEDEYKNSISIQDPQEEYSEVRTLVNRVVPIAFERRLNGSDSISYSRLQALNDFENSYFPLDGSDNTEEVYKKIEGLN